MKVKKYWSICMEIREDNSVEAVYYNKGFINALIVTNQINNNEFQELKDLNMDAFIKTTK